MIVTPSILRKIINKNLKMESERINLVGSNSNSNSGKGGSKKGRKVITLTALKKKELCEYKIANPNVTNEELRQLFQISKSTVGDILRAKEKWISIEESSEEAKKKRNREGECPKIEEALVTWIDLANKANYTIIGAILAQKAVEFARKLNISGFNASTVSRHLF